MDKSINIELSLSEGDSASVLKKKVFEQELKSINSKYPIEDNEFDIRQTYLVRTNDRVEVGFFIRNALKSQLALEHVLLILKDKKNNKIASKLFNFKEHDPIPPYSARHFTIDFKLLKENKYIDGEEYTLHFAQQDKLTITPTVITEIENMPINLSYEEEMSIRDFADSLNPLKNDEFNITIYSLKYKSSGAIVLIVLMRNGKDVTVSLTDLPVSIISDDGTIVASKVFENKKGLFNIGPRKSKLITLEFNPLEVTSEKYDLSKCTIAYK